MSKHLESLRQNILHGKLPHNLSWSEAVELIEHMGEVEPRGGDEVVFRVGSQCAFFKLLKDAGSGEMLAFQKIS